MRTLIAKTNELDKDDINSIKFINSLSDEQLINLLTMLVNPTEAATLLNATIDRVYATYDLVREVLIDRKVIEETIQ